MFVKFRHCRVTPFPPFPYCIFRKEVTMWSSHFWGEQLIPHLVGRLPTSVVWNPSAGKMCLFSSTYLFIQLSISVWTQGYLFYPLGYNSTLFCSSNCFAYSHWELFHLIPAFLWHSIMVGFVFVLEHFLTFRCYMMLQVYLLFFLSPF